MVTLTILNGYRMFTEGYVYWNETNPGDIGLTIVRYIYQQAFQRNEFGMGSAIGVVLLVIVLTVNMFQMKRRMHHNESAQKNGVRIGFRLIPTGIPDHVVPGILSYHRIAAGRTGDIPGRHEVLS